MEEEEERWASDEATTFDATNVPAAKKALEPLVALAREVEALGFVELGRTGTTVQMEMGEEVPVPSAADLAEAEAAAETGDPNAVERLAWMRELAWIHQFGSGSTSYAWYFVHPETHDAACLEWSQDMAWLSMYRLGEDGTIARTLRRTSREPLPNVAASGMFHAARLPGLHALMLRLAGETQLQMMSSSPRAGLWARLEPHGDAAALFEAHRRLADAHVHGAVRFDLDLVMALDRRLTSGTIVRLEKAGEVAAVWMFAWDLLVARGLATVVVGLLSGSWLHGGIGFFALPLAAGTCWTWSVGMNAWWSAGVVLLGLAAWIGLLGAPPVAVLAGFAVALFGVVVAALGHHWLCNAGVGAVCARLEVPMQVPAERLRVLYRA